MDVDKSIRILELVCCDNYKNLSVPEREKLAQDFLNIDDKNKPIAYRNLKNISEILATFDQINHNLRSVIKQELKLNVFQIIKKPNNDNRKGYDAVIVSNEGAWNLEMKFGRETLGNFGQVRMNKIFSISKKTKPFNFVEAGDVIQENQTQLINAGVVDYETLAQELRICLLEIVERMHQTPLIPNDEEIDKLVQSKRDESAPTIKFEILNDRVRLKETFALGGWTLNHIGVLDNKERIEILVQNREAQLRFLLNWKNNYVINGIKFPAKTGGTSSSWNVWIKKIKNPKDTKN